LRAKADAVDSQLKVAGLQQELLSRFWLNFGGCAQLASILSTDGVGYLEWDDLKTMALIENRKESIPELSAIISRQQDVSLAHPKLGTSSARQHEISFYKTIAAGRGKMLRQEARRKGKNLQKNASDKGKPQYHTHAVSSNPE
jgi:hypothetical protein